MNRAVAAAAVALLATAGCGGEHHQSMPDLRGKPRARAMKMLAADGICSVLASPADWWATRDVRRGIVVDQDPVPGEQVDRFATVTLWVKGYSVGQGGDVFAAPGCPGGDGYVIVNVSN